MPKSFRANSASYEINVIAVNLDVEGKPGMTIYRYSADFRIKGETAWTSILDEQGEPAYSDSDGKAVLAAKEFIRHLAAEVAQLV